MEKKSNSRNDVIIAGLGGMGVLLAGRILALAALERYRHVSWFPTYAVEKRGGLCECTVIFANEEIPSPIIDQAQAVIVLTGSQFKAFEPRILPGGMMLVDSAGLEEGEQTRVDYSLISIPGMEIAVSTGSLQITNLILLGAYIGITDKVPPEIVEQVIGKMLGADNTTKDRNENAFRRGIELGLDKIS